VIFWNNYKTFGVVSNPNLLGVRSRTSKIIESESLQLPPPKSDEPFDEFEPLDSGSELEEDGQFFFPVFISNYKYLVKKDYIFDKKLFLGN
jgi:hypothetical protein